METVDCLWAYSFVIQKYGAFYILWLLCPLGGEATMSWKCESEWVRAGDNRIQNFTRFWHSVTNIVCFGVNLCSATLALGMIRCIIFKRKNNFYWNKLFCASYDLFFVPEKSWGIIFSVFAVTLQKIMMWMIMNNSQSFHDCLLPILDYNQNFSCRKIRSCSVRLI